MHYESVCSAVCVQVCEQVVAGEEGVRREESEEGSV